MSGKKYTEEDICPVDLQVKTTVVTNAINLAEKKFTTIQETESFRSLTRVHPTQGEPDPADESEYVYQICEIMRKVYYSLTPLKNKAFMTAQNFEKIMQKGIVASKMAKNGYQKVDLAISFQTASGNQRNVDFLGFCFVMSKFYEEKVTKYAPGVELYEFLESLIV